MTDLAIGPQVVGPDEITRVDLGLLDELVDLDRARRLQCDVLELFLGHLDEDVLVEGVSLDDVLVGHLLARIAVHLEVFDPVAGLTVQLVERDLLGLGSGRIERDRTGDERQTQEAFPIGARGHYAKLHKYGRLGFKTNGTGWFRHARHRIHPQPAALRQRNPPFGPPGG